MIKGHLYFMRHCATNFNQTNYISGASDVPIVCHKIDISCYTHEKKVCIVSSPLTRCLETSQILSSQIQVSEIKKDERLQERDMGLLDGQIRSTAIKQFPQLFSVGGKFIPTLTPPSGESYNAFLGRVESAWVDILNMLNYSDVIIVSHNQTLKLLYSVIFDLDAKSIWETINFENGKLVHIDCFESKGYSKEVVLA